MIYKWWIKVTVGEWVPALVYLVVEELLTVEGHKQRDCKWIGFVPMQQNQVLAGIIIVVCCSYCHLKLNGSSIPDRSKCINKGWLKTTSAWKLENASGSYMLCLGESLQRLWPCYSCFKVLWTSFGACNFTTSQLLLHLCTKKPKAEKKAIFAPFLD